MERIYAITLQRRCNQIDKAVGRSQDNIQCVDWGSIRGDEEFMRCHRQRGGIAGELLALNDGEHTFLSPPLLIELEFFGCREEVKEWKMVTVEIRYQACTLSCGSFSFQLIFRRGVTQKWKDRRSSKELNDGQTTQMYNLFQGD